MEQNDVDYDFQVKIFLQGHNKRISLIIELLHDVFESVHYQSYFT